MMITKELREQLREARATLVCAMECIEKGYTYRAYTDISDVTSCLLKILAEEKEGE